MTALGSEEGRGAAPRILVNGAAKTLADVPATMTLLDWLREHERLCGTKEGCAEGDCGACTVILEREGPDGEIRRDAINACLTMVGQVDGSGIRTIEGLAPLGGPLHPVQSAFAAGGGTQCGFCTPGFVMSAYAYAREKGPVNVADMHDALAGNLCRCTGYRPIVDAVKSVAPLEADPVARFDTDLVDSLRAIARDDDACFTEGGGQFHVPRSLAAAAILRARHPAALLLAGGTDLGLLASRERQPPAQIIHLAGMPELNVLEDSGAYIAIGAAVTYARALPLLCEHYPALRTYLTRLGSRQTRNMGTIGGNLGTASPIGDFLPVLLALDAKLVLFSSRGGRRHLDAANFFLGYRKTALAEDELIEAIHLPKPAPTSLFFADKISKRRDQDISSVCAAYRLEIADGLVGAIRIAFGGLAATPKRALAVERVLLGRRLDEATLAEAEGALGSDFTPLSDWRGSAAYRLAVAGNLLHRLRLRATQPEVPAELDALCP